MAVQSRTLVLIAFATGAHGNMDVRVCSGLLGSQIDSILGFNLHWLFSRAKLDPDTLIAIPKQSRLIAAMLLHFHVYLQCFLHRDVARRSTGQNSLAVLKEELLDRYGSLLPVCFWQV